MSDLLENIAKRCAAQLQIEFSKDSANYQILMYFLKEAVKVSTAENEMNASSESKALTPCEKLGYKVGDKFKVVSDKPAIEIGSVITLKNDDGTVCPAFYCESLDGDGWDYIFLDEIEPYCEIVSQEFNEEKAASIAPTLWNAYKDILNEEALEALKQVICDVDNHNKINFEDDSDVDRAFVWVNTKQGEDFWDSVYNGEMDKKQIEVVTSTVAEERKHNHYFKECGYEYVDVYRILKLFDVVDPCIQHAAKKLLVSGGRGFKEISHDIQDVIDTLIRWQEMQEEDNAKQSSN